MSKHFKRPEMKLYKRPEMKLYKRTEMSKPYKRTLLNVAQIYSVHLALWLQRS